MAKNKDEIPIPYFLIFCWVLFFANLLLGSSLAFILYGAIFLILLTFGHMFVVHKMATMRPQNELEEKVDNSIPEKIEPIKGKCFHRMYIREKDGRYCPQCGVVMDDFGDR